LMTLDKAIPAQVSSDKPQSIAIIGAGLAGLACANALRAHGHSVTLFDKSRGPGGRMSTRRAQTDLGELQFDHGAQYFTSQHPRFAAQVHRWVAQGHAAVWANASMATGKPAYIGIPSMNAPVKALAEGHTIHWNAKATAIHHDAQGWHITLETSPENAASETEGSPYAALLIAIPPDQAAPLLAPWDAAMSAAAAQTPSAPCWTVMAAFAQPLPKSQTILRATSTKDFGPIGWAACNSTKPLRPASALQTWVIQAPPEWSAANLTMPAEQVSQTLLAALGTALNQEIPEPAYVTAHRWLYARAGSLGQTHLYNPVLSLGACGDWLLGPRIENAWLSGTALAEAVA
jgi:renalase